MGRVLSWFTPGALTADPVDFKAKESATSNASVGGGPPNHATLPFHQHKAITELEVLPNLHN